MLILDTDHLSALASDRAVSGSLLRRLADSGQDVAITIVSVEEQFRGWLARIGGARSKSARISAYAKFQRCVEELGQGLIVPFDAPAAAEFDSLKELKLGIGTMDLRIAAIAKATRSKLLSRNLKDFARVPGLQVEDWLH